MDTGTHNWLTHVPPDLDVNMAGMEVFFPVFRLLEEGWQVDIAASSMKEMSGKYDLLIIPGGAPNGAPATVGKIKKCER